MSKGSYWVRAPFNCLNEPVTQVEIRESGPHWQKVREMRNGLPQGVHRFRTKREVAMAVLLWEMREWYRERMFDHFPDHLSNEERAEWLKNRDRMKVIVGRIDECLTMIN